MSLGDSEWVFAHDQLETPELVAVGDGDRWVLVHGTCFYAGDDDRNISPAHPLAEAATSRGTQFLDTLDVLGGRHVVLLGNENTFSLYQDAIGMRSVYFSPYAKVIGSHANLLNDIHSHDRRTPEQGLHGFMRAWERTPYLGISALLPNHSISVPQFTVRRFFPRQDNQFSSWSIDGRIKEFRRLWDRQWKSLTETNPKLVMSVTGGNDSRTTLALLAEHLDSINTFTYTTSRPPKTPREESLRLDRKIVEQIKTYISLNHEFIVEPVKRPSLDDRTRMLLSKNTIGKHGSWLLPHYLKHYSGANFTHIRGNAYGVYKFPWMPVENDDTFDDLKKQYLKLTRDDSTHETQVSREEHFRSGAELWDYSKNLYDFHRFEILFWELRLGRWASEIYNETDIAFNSFEPTNVRRMLEIATSFTYSQKINKLFQAELINNALPILNFPGKNDVRNLYEQYRDQRDVPSTAPRDESQSTENTHALEPVATISHNDGVRRAIKLSTEDIFIPGQDFYPGRSITREFEPIITTGDLTFTVINSYSNIKALGTWVFEILVDGKPQFRWDGAYRHRPVHISINNLRKGALVAVRLVPLKDRQHKTSWERATKTFITSCVFDQGQIQGNTTVAADIPGQDIH